jgi:hypothetical protein
MKLGARKVAWLLPLLLSACVHNTNQSQVQSLAPPIEDAPPPPPDTAPANLPAPVITIPKTDKPVVVVQEPPKQPPKHKKQPPKTTPADSQAGQQVAANTPPSEVNAGGTFATPEKPDEKKLAEDSITEVEKGLNGIAHKLSETDEKTSLQIKEYLKEARAALNTGDVDGAKTLTVKAKALLSELVP